MLEFDYTNAMASRVGEHGLTDGEWAAALVAGRPAFEAVEADETLAVGEYRLIFETKTYFQSQNIEGFYPQVTVTFSVREAAQHYHVPLLLSPFGYSTYRGS